MFPAGDCGRETTGGKRDEKMKLIVKPSRLAGEIAVIGSKSHTIRGIAAALMANGTSVLHAPLDSADTRSTLGAAMAFGAEVRETEGRWEITVYSSCCNMDRGVYYYTTYENSRISAVDMHREDLDGAELTCCPLRREEDILAQN